jgi:hypothetical protein
VNVTGLSGTRNAVPEALQTMTDDEGLSVREAVEWCGSGVTVQEVTRLRRLTKDLPDGDG